MANKSKYLILAFFLLAFDQIIKNICLIKYPNQISINYGIFFGQITNNFIVISLLLLGFIILIYLFIKYYKQNYLPIILISCGALSNLADRIFYGGVVDYINIGFWSRFNLADVYIFAGVFIYLIDVLRKQKTS